MCCEWLLLIASRCCFKLGHNELCSHDDDPDVPRSAAEILEANHFIVNKFISTFDVNRTFVIPTIGNNDVHPHNSFHEQHAMRYLETLAHIWRPFLDRTLNADIHLQLPSILTTNAFDNFRKHGYFHQRITSSLTVLSVNSLYFFRSNEQAADCDNILSPSYQHITWIREVLQALLQLQTSSGLQQYVLVVGHIAPVSSLYTPSCYNGYLQLVRAYHSLIQGHFYGHTNFDYFNLVYDTDVISAQVVPVASIFTAPSVVPIMNTGIRVYDFLESSGSSQAAKLLDYHQYVALLSVANHNQKLSFFRSYSFRETYKVDSLQPIELHRLYNRFLADETLWKTFLRNMVTLRRKWIRYIDEKRGAAKKIWRKMCKLFCDGYPVSYQCLSLFKLESSPP